MSSAKSKVCVVVLYYAPDLIPPLQTNVAMLTILSKLAKHRDETTGTFDLDSFTLRP